MTPAGVATPDSSRAARAGQAERAWRVPRSVQAGTQGAIALAARALARLRLELHVEGTDNVPARGPVLLAVRHVHHLWDGVALLAAAPRPVHLLVGLEWIGGRPARAAMELATSAAAWPVVLRAEGFDPRVRTRRAGPRSAFEPDEAMRYLRRAHARVLALLAGERAVAVFPQGFPRVDPHLAIANRESFRHFQPGIVGFAAAAQRRAIPVAIVPVGLTYENGAGADAPAVATARRARTGVRLRFGAPMYGDARRDPAALLAALEARVRTLSGCVSDAGDRAGVL